MADNRYDEAIAVIAKRIVANAAFVESQELNDADYASTEDRDVVASCVRGVAMDMDPGADAFEAAVEFLASRKAGEQS